MYFTVAKGVGVKSMITQQKRLTQRNKIIKIYRAYLMRAVCFASGKLARDKSKKDRVEKRAEKLERGQKEKKIVA